MLDKLVKPHLELVYSCYRSAVRRNYVLHFVVLSVYYVSRRAIKIFLKIFKILVTFLAFRVLYIVEGQVDGFISNPVNPSYFALSQPNGMWLEA